MLYVVPTPIGNMEDITLRALRLLREADLVLAEDTRTSGVLLSHFDIRKPMLAHHKFNEHGTLPSVVSRIKALSSVVLLSDAGTPGISDPGFLLVRECVREGIEVQTLPGPTALIPAVVNSALPCDRFCFEGFLPPKKGRQTRLSQLAEEERTIILYESPRRLTKTLQQLAETLGEERPACVCRELSKLHEESRRATLSELAAHYTEHEPKGEIVLVIAGAQHEKEKLSPKP